jgi:hypothetical protein
MGQSNDWPTASFRFFRPRRGSFRPRRDALLLVEKIVWLVEKPVRFALFGLKPATFGWLWRQTLRGPVAFPRFSRFYEVGNHMSLMWMLISRKGVGDTHLSSYQLTQDSLRSVAKMLIGLTRLPALDEGSRQELLQLMQQDERDYRKRATDSH